MFNENATMAQTGTWRIIKVHVFRKRASRYILTTLKFSTPLISLPYTKAILKEERQIEHHIARCFNFIYWLDVCVIRCQ